MKALDLYEEGELEQALQLVDEALAGAGRVRLVEGHLHALRVLCLRELDEEENEDTPLRDEPDWTAELLSQECSKEFLLAAGIFLSDHDAHDLAEEILEQLCERKDLEKRHVAVFNLALVRERDGRLDEAADGYREAIAIAPDWPLGHLYLSRCLRDANELDEAVAPLEAYLELEPADMDEWISLAILHSNAGRFHSADLAYERAASLDPTSTSLNFNRGITARRAGDRERLTSCLRALESLEPEDWRTQLLIGYSNELDGRLWPAWEAFSEAADLELLSGEEDEARECAAAHALAFAVEHDMEAQAEDVTARCFSTFTFSHEILHQLRRMGRRHAIEASDFEVLIQSDLTDEDAIRQLQEEDEIGPPYCFFRSYRVIADTDAVAGDLAVAFEERLGGRNVLIEKVHRIGPVQDVFLGVWWLARELHCFSKDSAEEV